MSNLILPQKTIHKIEDAAVSLIAAGNPNPTNEQVRAKLGGGSLSNISPVMRNFRARQRALNVETVPLMPSELHHSLNKQLEVLWKLAYQMAEKSCQVNLEQAFVSIAQIEQERDEALNQVALMENEALMTKQVINERDRLLSEVLEWRTQAFQLKEQATRLSVINEQLTHQINDIKKDLTEARALNEALQSEFIRIARNN